MKKSKKSKMEIIQLVISLVTVSITVIGLLQRVLDWTERFE